jgi:hypothetical protein
LCTILLPSAFRKNLQQNEDWFPAHAWYDIKRVEKSNVLMLIA